MLRTTFLPRPQLPIQAAVVDGLAQVAGADVGAAFQIGDRAGHTEDAVVSAGGKAQVFHGVFEQVAAFFIQHAMAAKLPAGHAAVEAMAVGAEALLLRVASSVDLLAHQSTRRSVGACR